MTAKIVKLGGSQKVFVFILLGILAVAACAWIIVEFKQRALMQQYEVYSAFVQETFPEWFRDSKIKVLPIARDYLSCAGSSLQNSAASERLIWLQKSHPGVSDDLLLRYYSSFLSHGFLLNRFSLQLPTVLVAEEKLDCNKNEWCIEEFIKTYPSAPGLLSFSHVGFSADGHQAMFEYSYDFCPLCIHGGTVLMEKKSGRWHVRENYGGWTS